MARAMTVHAVCDNCGVTGDEDNFQMDRTMDISLLTRKPRIMDLCTDRTAGGKDCNGQFESAVRPWIELARINDTSSRHTSIRAASTTVTAAALLPPKDGPLCDAEGCVKGPNGGPFIARSPQGLLMHKVRSHGAPAVKQGTRTRAR